MGRVDDPFTVLGVGPDATPQELAAAYRRLAKAWHPDTQLSPDAGAHMARINAAYAAAREIRANPRAAPSTAPRRPSSANGRGAARPVAAHWLDQAMRRALGPELTRALADHEDVLLVAPTSTWASPQTRLAVTDRRLLWLHEDVLGDRVHGLRFDAITWVDHRPRWPRRRTSTLRVRDGRGRRFAFSDLDPGTAAQLARHLRGRLAA
jgi:DnaJ domain